MLRKQLIIIFLGCLIFIACSKGYDKNQVSESWKTENQKFEIYVTSYKEKHPFSLVPGEYYVFESTSSKNDRRLEIMTFRNDDPILINKDGVKFINDDTAFVFMGYMFAVTVDSGNSWTLWDSRNHKYLKDKIDYGSIKTVDIQKDGKGTMTLWVFPSKNDCQTLFTKDYGRNWINSQ